jgi:hypothetical protein
VILGQPARQFTAPSALTEIIGLLCAGLVIAWLYRPADGAT